MAKLGKSLIKTVKKTTAAPKVQQRQTSQGSTQPPQTQPQPQQNPLSTGPGTLQAAATSASQLLQIAGYGLNQFFQPGAALSSVQNALGAALRRVGLAPQPVQMAQPTRSPYNQYNNPSPANRVRQGIYDTAPVPYNTSVIGFTATGQPIYGRTNNRQTLADLAAQEEQQAGLFRDSSGRAISENQFNLISWRNWMTQQAAQPVPTTIPTTGDEGGAGDYWGGGWGGWGGGSEGSQWYNGLLNWRI